MNDYACILIWDAHTRMGHNIVPYAYGISHTRMGRPIRVWHNIRIWGRTHARAIWQHDIYARPVIVLTVPACICIETRHGVFIAFIPPSSPSPYPLLTRMYKHSCNAVRIRCNIRTHLAMDSATED